MGKIIKNRVIYGGTPYLSAETGDVLSVDTDGNVVGVDPAELDVGIASKLGSSDVGSATQPIYLDDGSPTACTYTLGKSVPSDAIFTDHYDWSDITSKPTTLSGYGITDAKINNGTITLGSNTITPLTSHQDISGKVDKAGDTMTGTLTTKNGRVSWVHGRDGAGIKNTAYNGDGSWYPVTTVKSKDGSWEQGTLSGNNTYYFSYASDSNYSANSNKSNKFRLDPIDSEDHDYLIAHSGNVSTGDSNGQIKIAGTNVSVKGLGTNAYSSTSYVAKSGDTMTGQLDLRGTAASKPLKTRGIVGSNGSGTDGELHLQYGNSTDDSIIFGNTGGGEIKSNGTLYTGCSAGFEVPRTNSSCNYSPGNNKGAIKEFNGSDLPSSHFYHVYTTMGGDNRYACQLALGMTTTGAYYRRCDNSTWGNWQPLFVKSESQTPTSGGSKVKLYRYGKVVTLIFNGCKYSERGSVPSGWRPQIQTWNPVVYASSGYYKKGYVYVMTDGTIGANTEASQWSGNTPAAGDLIYGEITWILE